MLTLYELWAGERLSLEQASPRYLRLGRPISVSAVPFGPGIDIWRSCRLIGALMRSLRLLPGGLGRFVPCSIGANHCRLRHIGWEKCGHGLTSRPRESASELLLFVLLRLFRYPPRSGRALLAGTLPLRYWAACFACKTPTWQLPVPGCVVDLVAVHDGAGREDLVAGVRQEVCWVRSSGLGWKRIRRNRKTPAHLAGLVVQSRHVFVRDCIQLGTLAFLFLIARGGGAIRMIRRMFLLRSGLGWCSSLGLCLPTSPGSLISRLLRCIHEVM